MFRDQLNDDQREELVGWARDGRVLVVLDPGSPLVPLPSADSFFGLDPDQLDPGFCTIDALSDVGAIAPGDTSGLEVDAASRPRPASGTASSPSWPPRPRATALWSPPAARSSR